MFPRNTTVTLGIFNTLDLALIIYTFVHLLYFLSISSEPLGSNRGQRSDASMDRGNCTLETVMMRKG